MNVMYTGSERRKISDIHKAVARLGFQEVQNIALSTSLFKMFAKTPAHIFNRRDFWRHSISTATASVELSLLVKKKKDIPLEDLHLAGLVHDLGKIILEAHFRDTFEQSLKLAMQESPRTPHTPLQAGKAGRCPQGHDCAQGD